MVGTDCSLLVVLSDEADSLSSIFPVKQNIVFSSILLILNTCSELDLCISFAYSVFFNGKISLFRHIIAVN